jgi:heat-inducible transcriptional repressor
MTSPLITERESQVLLALINRYIQQGHPIGSKALLDSEDLGISPATIRNTLVRLEDKGMVYQPHTSAGRVPTDKGYRLYVELGLKEGFSGNAEELGQRWMVEAKLQQGNVDAILGQLASIVGDVSCQLGIVMAPVFEQGIFHTLELVRLSDNRLMLVLTIDQGFVKSLVIKVDVRVSQRELESVSQLLNQRLHGLTMEEIRASGRERLRSVESSAPLLLKVVVEEIEGLSEPDSTDLYIAGSRNLCLQPEFSDPLRMAGLMDMVEKKEPLAHLLSGRQGMVITIGDEHECQEMHLCSMVTASYDVNGIGGVIGVIGPTRMPYGRVVALVNYAATRVGTLVI